MLYQGKPIAEEQGPAKKKNEKSREWVKTLLLAAIIILPLSWFMKNRLPAESEILPQMLQEPLQTKGKLPGPMDISAKGVTYTVTPLFHYDLHGMVVSYHHSDSFTDISHKRWGDYLNIKDLCVIWGQNLSSGVYQKLKFRSGNFTCYYSYSDADVGQLFCSECLSNNHILCSNKNMARLIRSVRRGDQIRMRGFLARYGVKSTGFERGTSITRTDTGNGACETVYLTYFSVLKRANPFWHYLWNAGIVLLILSLLLFFFL